MTTRTRRREKQMLAFAVYPGLTPLDLIGPLTVLRNLTGTRYRTVVVAERTDRLATDTALRVVPAASFTEVPAPFAVIVPGGGPATVAAMADEALVGYVRTAAATAQLVGATGNGALILGAAGLLTGRRAAAHWAYAEHLERSGATWAREPWVEDGRLLTAAGGAAGIDAMLALLARLKSRSSAQLAQLFMEYDPEPPLGPLGRDRGDPDLAVRLRTPRPRAARAEDHAEPR
ncbi:MULTISPECIES: DJ-1/PfpI family protein [unclassified Geodermatophilus]|uniref:DJ-1/PfpI family protein n=1 Tax=unclassified Geodermatophilus TaxID=2637632 RepID=UPI003EE8B2E2